jgi:small subunit ribosomal protein S7
MKDGKKSKAEELLFSLFQFLSTKSDLLPSFVFSQALRSLSPLVTVRSVKVRGRSYQIPIPLKESKQLGIGMKWLIQECRELTSSKGGSFSDNLNQQVFLAFQKKGELLKKKVELHKLAKSNRVFANYRWF